MPNVLDPHDVDARAGTTTPRQGLAGFAWGVMLGATAVLLAIGIEREVDGAPYVMPLVLVALAVSVMGVAREGGGISRARGLGALAGVVLVLTLVWVAAYAFLRSLP